MIRRESKKRCNAEEDQVQKSGANEWTAKTSNNSSQKSVAGIAPKVVKVFDGADGELEGEESGGGRRRRGRLGREYGGAG